MSSKVGQPVDSQDTNAAAIGQNGQAIAGKRPYPSERLRRGE